MASVGCVQEQSNIHHEAHEDNEEKDYKINSVIFHVAS
jgi:hypothetical protein